MTADLNRRALLRGVGLGAVAAAAGALGAAAIDTGTAHAILRPTGSISIPKLGMKNRTVYAGIANDTLAAGVGHGLWSAPLGSGGHVQLFAHRSTKPGLFRNLHKLKKGDQITVSGVTYKVRFIEIVSVNDKNRIWKYDGSGARISLVACSKKNGLPSSTSYRICVRASV